MTSFASGVSKSLDNKHDAANRNPQKLKTLELYKIFSTYTDAAHGLSCNELIDKLAERGFAAERKSIYRDIHALQDAGVPVEQIPGSPITYALIERTFTLDELQLLIDAISSCRWLSDDEINTLVGKLSRFCSVHEQMTLSNHTCIVDRPHYDGPSPLDNINTINCAINSHHKIEFNYIKYDIHGKAIIVSPLDKSWTVTPVALLYGNSTYYLIGYLPLSDALSISSFFSNDEEGGLFLIRLDSMKEVRISNQPAHACDLIKNFDIQDLPRMTMYATYLKDVTLSFKRDDIDASCTLVNHFGKDLTVREATGTDYIQVSVKAAPSPEMFGWLMQMADKIWLIGPQEVKDQYWNWIQTHINPHYKPEQTSE